MEAIGASTRGKSCKEYDGRRRGVGGVAEKPGEEGMEKKVGCRGNEKEKNMEKQKVKKRCRGGGKLVFTFLFLNAI